MYPCPDIVLGNPEFGLHLKKLSRDGVRRGPRGLLGAVGKRGVEGILF